MNRRHWALALAVAAFAVLAMGADSCSTESDSDSKDTSSDSESKDTAKAKGSEKPKEAKKSCGTKATDDCTPHVGPKGTVRVDALNWHIASAKTAASLGDASIGFDEKANGVYAIVNLGVKSDKDESATLTDDVVTLKVGDRSYKPDSDGTIAAIGAGDEPFFLEDIGPDSTLSGIVVFDVPPAVLKQKPELCFGELGFGSTEGCIRMPAL